MSHQLIGQLAAVIALLNLIPYLRSIFSGHTRPSRAAYAIWLIIDVVTTASYIASGARATAWLSIAFTITTIIIFVLSIKYGMGGYNRLDLYCFVLAAITITLWITTKNPVIALYTGLFAKLCGYVPIFKKVYLHPRTENTLAWQLSAIAAAFNLFALNTWQLQIFLLPACLALADTSISLLLMKPAWRHKGRA